MSVFQSGQEQDWAGININIKNISKLYPGFYLDAKHKHGPRIQNSYLYQS